MKIRVCAPILVVLLAALPMTLPAQQKANAKTKAAPAPAPRKADGKPDFGGVWQTPRMADVTKDEACCKGVKNLPFTAWGKQQWESYDATKDGDYAGACLPFGLLRSVGGPHPVQIIQDDKYIAMLYEQNSWFHVTPIDGRPHPKDIDPTWFGNSVGHWEGDTLVIETNNFRNDGWLDINGSPLTDQAKMTERWTRPTYGTLRIDVTIDDPKAYTAPFTVRLNQKLVPDGELIEFICGENERSTAHMIGK
jgi:hypothetical protein